MIISLLLLSQIWLGDVDQVSAANNTYGHALFRKDHILEAEPFKILNGITLVLCLAICQYQPLCRSFNYGKGECSLLSATLCDDKRTLLKEAPGYNYYDLTPSPTHETESKTWEYYECFGMGKCAQHCIPKYQLIFERSHWQKALDGCYVNKKCPQLAMPRNFIENEQLRHQLSKEKGDFWIGITDNDVQGIYRYYADLTVMPSSLNVAWAPGQPNNVSSENCVLVRAHEDQRWHDASCNSASYYVCQCY